MKMQAATQGYFISRALDLAPNTAELYRWAYDRMCNYLGNPDVTEITERQLQEFFVYLSTEYKPKRANGKTDPLTGRSLENVWTAMRSFFNWAEKEFNLKERPDKRIPKPKYQKRKIKPFTEDELARLMRACEFTKPANTTNRKAFVMRRRTYLRDLAIVSLLLDSGLRVSEVSRLNIEDVNLDSGEIGVKGFGTGQKTRERTVPIGNKARKALWRYLTKVRNDYPEAPLFVTVNGRRMNRNAIRLLLDDLGEKAGVRNCHPHRFRHTFSYFYLLNGGDIESLRKILGHTSYRMIKEYLELVKEDLKRIHRTASPLDRLRQ